MARHNTRPEFSIHAYGQEVLAVGPWWYHGVRFEVIQQIVLGPEAFERPEQLEGAEWLIVDSWTPVDVWGNVYAGPEKTVVSVWLPDRNEGLLLRFDPPVTAAELLPLAEHYRASRFTAGGQDVKGSKLTKGNKTGSYIPKAGKTQSSQGNVKETFMPSKKGK